MKKSTIIISVVLVCCGFFAVWPLYTFLISASTLVIVYAIIKGRKLKSTNTSIYENHIQDNRNQ